MSLLPLKHEPPAQVMALAPLEPAKLLTRCSLCEGYSTLKTTVYDTSYASLEKKIDAVFSSVFAEHHLPPIDWSYIPPLKISRPVRSLAHIGSFPHPENPKMNVLVYKGNKHTLVQPSMTGCTAACAAMLALDHGRILPMRTLVERGPAHDSDVAFDLITCGLRPLVVDISVCFDRAGYFDPAQAKLLVDKFGPCATGLRPDPGASLGHEVIIDGIDLEHSTVAMRCSSYGDMHECDLYEFIDQVNWDIEIFRSLGALSKKKMVFVKKL